MFPLWVLCSFVFLFLIEPFLTCDCNSNYDSNWESSALRPNLKEKLIEFILFQFNSILFKLYLKKIKTYNIKLDNLVKLVKQLKL